MISALHTSLIMSAQRYIVSFSNLLSFLCLLHLVKTWPCILRFSDQSLQKTLCSREGIKKRKLHAKNNPIWTNIYWVIRRKALLCLLLRSATPPFENMEFGYLYTHLQCKNMYKCTIKICRQKCWLLYRTPLNRPCACMHEAAARWNAFCTVHASLFEETGDNCTVAR
jgi:hypothetical protein